MTGRRGKQAEEWSIIILRLPVKTGGKNERQDTKWKTNEKVGRVEEEKKKKRRGKGEKRKKRKFKLNT